MARQATQVTTLRHKEAKRKHIPTAELEPVMRDEDKSPLRLAYERRNRDLDPQLVWRGKDQQDWSDLIVQAPPLYIQEKVHPKVLIDDLVRQSKARADEDWRALRDRGDLHCVIHPYRTEAKRHSASDLKLVPAIDAKPLTSGLDDRRLSALTARWKGVHRLMFCRATDTRGPIQ
jgi:hypothetical protein